MSRKIATPYNLTELPRVNLINDNDVVYRNLGIRANQKKRKLGEKDFENHASAVYPHVKRTGKGSDYEIGAVDPFTQKKKVEVKTGKHTNPSKLLKKIKTKIVCTKDLSTDSLSDYFLI